MLSNVKNGDIIQFGHYPQDANEYIHTPIEWQVLEVKDEKALLISKYCLDCKRYNKTLEDTTWEECTLRHWLNHDFLNRAFSEKERKQILNGKVSRDENPNYSTDIGNATTDKVFLLSIPEVEKYFSSDEDRMCVPTEYAIGQHAENSKNKTKYGRGTCWWWLRSPGAYQNTCARIAYGGSVLYHGDNVCERNCVRPALWINLDNNKEIIVQGFESCGSRPTVRLTTSAVKMVDFIQFGHYPQNADGKDNTPIDWQVLDIRDGKALLISKYGLDCKEYNDKYEKTTWEKCTLRHWLNQDFMNRAFSDEEQKRIPTITVSADEHPDFSGKPGNATRDKVFLLSITEVEQFFLVKEEKKCVPTGYAIAQGIYTDDSVDYYKKSGASTCWWWLRSPGDDQDDASAVDYGGSVSCRGFTVYYASACVRPALWINLES